MARAPHAVPWLLVDSSTPITTPPRRLLELSLWGEQTCDPERVGLFELRVLSVP